MNIGDIHFALRGDGSGLMVDAKKAAEAAGVTAGKSFSSKLGKQMKMGLGIGAGMTAFDMVGKGLSTAIDFMDDAVKSASNLNESMTLSQQVFEGNTAAVQDWADGAADAFGQSKREALDFASNFGTAFKNVGMSLDDTTDKAEAMTRLAADLGSAFNASSEEAATALRSGLLGESEPLRRFGVFLDEAKTKAKAVQMGIAKLGDTLTDEQKVTARYALIMEQTADSQGMFGRDSSSLADTQKSLGAEMENVSAAIGQELLPMMLGLAKVAKDDVVPALRDIVKAAGDVGDVVGKDIVDDVSLLDMALNLLHLPFDATTTAFNRAALGARVLAGDKGALRELAELLGADLPVATKLGDKAMTTFVDHVGASRDPLHKAAGAIAEIPPPAIYTRDELRKLAQSFRDTARTARDNRLDEAYDIAELPIKIRQARRDVKAAQQELEDARTGAERDAAKLRILEAQRELDSLINAMETKTDGFAALGHLLGTAYGRALFQSVAAWNRRTSNAPLPNPRFGGSTRNTDRLEGAATGMPFVAYDRPVYVHQAEAILTKPQAEAWRAGESGGGTTNVNVTVQGLVRARDPLEIATQLRRLASFGVLTPKPRMV